MDAEIPAPSAGILAEILAKEGDTVSVHSVVGTIQLAGEEPDPDVTRKQARPSASGAPPNDRDAPRCPHGVGRGAA